MAKQALGRGFDKIGNGGLADLLTDAPKKMVENNPSINEIRIDQIDPNPDQPRTVFDEEALNELSTSISQFGLIQPITVRQTADGRYQIISGERRWRASKLANKETIPAYVRTAGDEDVLFLALTENIQRQDLDPIEIALSYQRLMSECNLTQEALSDKVGKQRSTIANYVRLLKLPDLVQVALRQNKITTGHAKALINIEDANDQAFLLDRIITEGLSVRQLEEAANEMKTSPKKPSKKRNKKDNDFVDLESKLGNLFKSKVHLTCNDKGSGKLVISFKNDNELQQIIGLFDQLNK